MYLALVLQTLSCSNWINSLRKPINCFFLRDLCNFLELTFFLWLTGQKTIQFASSFWIAVMALLFWLDDLFEPSVICFSMMVWLEALWSSCDLLETRSRFFWNSSCRHFLFLDKKVLFVLLPDTSCLKVAFCDLLLYHGLVTFFERIDKLYHSISRCAFTKDVRFCTSSVPLKRRRCDSPVIVSCVACQSPWHLFSKLLRATSPVLHQYTLLLKCIEGMGVYTDLGPANWAVKVSFKFSMYHQYVQSVPFVCILAQTLL